MFHLMVSDNHWGNSTRKGIGKVPRRDVCNFRIYRNLQSVQWISGCICDDFRANARTLRQLILPEIKRSLLSFPNPWMVTFFPGLERCNRANDALLADLHAAADTIVLHVCGSN